MDPQASTLVFTATQLGTPFRGGFRRFDAEIRFDPARPEEARIVVTVDVTSAYAGAAQRNEQIGGADWFDTAAFPTARFASTAVRPLGGGRYEVAADLAIRDAVRSVTVPTTIAIEGDRARAQGTVTLDRTAFGVGRGQWADGKAVGITVEVAFDVAATRAP